MKVKRKLENQYYENDTTDETWVLVGGELKQITGEDNEDDDSEEGQ